MGASGLPSTISTTLEPEFSSAFAASEELKLPLLYTDEEMLSSVREVVKAYPRVDIGAATCLTPIKEFMNSAYKTEVHDVHLLFDLLPKLQSQNIIEGYYQMNLDDAMRKGELLMKRYSVFEVNEAIHKSLLNETL